MSWTGTYSHNVLIGLDQFGAAVFFNRNELCISSLCRLVQLADQGNSTAFRVLLGFEFSKFQVAFLRALAKVLDRIETNHCALSLQGDLERAVAAQGLLGALNTLGN